MRFAALLDKELREGLRAGWANIPATALAAVALLATSEARAPFLVFLPLVAMPFHAGTVLSRSIQTERLQGGLLPLLIYGGRPVEVWSAKVAAAFLLAYAASLLALAGFWLFIAPPPAGTLPHLLVTMPLASLGLISLEAFLFWVMGNSSMLAVALPLALLFGSAQLVSRIGTEPLLLALASLLATTVILLGVRWRGWAVGGKPPLW
ncbi:MAG TPA: hypothetical protein VFP80_02470 [Thermoanaerobaculia bacterium]|nr:hypothetical protein [Thermoanaerobaculia bacterium]